MLGRTGRTSTRKPNSLNCRTLTPIEGCSGSYVFFSPHLACTTHQDKAISPHFSKLHLDRCLWDLPTIRNSSDLVPTVAGWALETTFWFWLESGKILLQKKDDKNRGGWRPWKRWHIFLMNLLRTSTFLLSWTRTNKSLVLFPVKIHSKMFVRRQIERRKQETPNVFWVLQHLWIWIVFSLP